MGKTISIQKFLDNTIQGAIEQKLFPGCGIGFENYGEGKIITAFSNTLIPESDKKYSEKTLFDISSLTKMITGLIALRLIDQGYLTLDSPIQRALTNTLAHLSWLLKNRNKLRAILLI